MSTSLGQRVDRRGRIEPTLGPRALGDGETVQSSDRIRMGEIFGSNLTHAGTAVTPNSAMRVAAVYACVRLLSGMLASVSKRIFERIDADTNKQVRHDFWWLLNEAPCPGWSAATMWEWIMACVLLRGDGIAWIQRNRQGIPIALVPWHRDRVYVDQVATGDPRIPRRNRYFFHSEDGTFGADQDDVLHFPGFGFDGRTGMSVIQWGARNGIGIAQRSDEFAGKFFGQGSQPMVAVMTDKKMEQGQKDAFAQAWEDRYGGYNVGPSNRPLILTEGLKIHQLSMTGRDAQLLESRQWNVIDIARAFGLPPFMVGEMGKATYNNTENLGTDVVKYAFGPHVIRFEQELNIKLFRMPRFFASMNVDSLQRGDLVTRGNYYKTAVGGTQNPAWMTVNEVRNLEKLPPVDGGDVLVVPKANEPAPPSDDDTPPEPKKPDPSEPDETEEDDTP